MMIKVIRRGGALLALVSTIFSVAVFVLWVRSSEVEDSVIRFSQNGANVLSASVGVIRFKHEPATGYALILPPGMVPTIYRHTADRPPRNLFETPRVGERILFNRLGVVVWYSHPAANPQGLMWGVSLPCWLLLVLFLLLPMRWFISVRRKLRGQQPVSPPHRDHSRFAIGGIFTNFKTKIFILILMGLVSIASALIFLPKGHVIRPTHYVAGLIGSLVPPGWTPVMAAAFSGEADHLNVLLDSGNPVDAQGDEGFTALSLACSAGQAETTAVLLAHGADANLSDIFGNSPLSIAAGIQRRDLVGLLLSHHADVNCRDSKGNTPLTIVLAGNGPMELVDDLLNHGADLAKRGTDQRLPLGAAAAASSPEMIRKLLKAGAPFDAINARAAMDAAISFERSDNLQCLIENGADVNTRDANGATLLIQFGSSPTRINCLRLLIRGGADVNAKNNNGDTAIFLATMTSAAENVHLLEEAGAVLRRK